MLEVTVVAAKDATAAVVAPCKVPTPATTMPVADMMVGTAAAAAALAPVTARAVPALPIAISATMLSVLVLENDQEESYFAICVVCCVPSLEMSQQENRSANRGSRMAGVAVLSTP